MSGKAMGIEELKRMVYAVITMGNACGLAFEDKKIGITDIDDLLAFGGAAKSLATEVDFKAGFKQFTDIDNDEMGELVAMVEEHFDIPEELVEDKVKQLVGIAARQYALIQEVIYAIKHPATMG